MSSPMLLALLKAVPAGQTLADIASAVQRDSAFSLVPVFAIGGKAIGPLIFAVFLWGAYAYLRPLYRAKRAFEYAADQLDSVESPDGIDVFPHNAGHLNSLWGEFLQERKDAVVEVNGEAVSTVAPEDVFTEEKVLHGYNRNIAVTLAGVFTGLGILGTFLGLVVGMSEINMQDADRVLNSVNSLLGGMSTAFYTSIWGIVASLFWLFLDRSLIHAIQRETGRFFLAVRRRYPVESTDQLLHRLLAVEQEESNAIQQSRDILLEQKAILQHLGTDLATAFESAINDSLSTSLKAPLETLASTLEQLSVHFGERQVEALQQMVDTFQQRLSEQMGGHLERLAETIRATCEWHERVHQGLEDLLARLQSAAQAQTTLVELGNEAFRLYTDSIGHLNRAHEDLARAAKNIEAVAHQSGEIVAQLGKRTLELQSQLDLYSEANEAIRTHLATQLDAVESQVDALTNFWSGFRDQLDRVAETLQESISEFSAFTAEKLREVFSRFDSEMATVVQHLGGTLAELREVSEDLPSSVERLKGAVDRALVPFEHARDAMGQLTSSLTGLDSLAASIDQVSARVTETSSSIQGLDRRIQLADQHLVAVLNALDRVQSLREVNNGATHVASKQG